MPFNCTKNNWNIPGHIDDGILYVSECTIVSSNACIDGPETIIYGVK